MTLSGGGSVTLGAKTLTLTSGTGTFSGVIGGSGGLTVDGSGTETLSGVNTYGGATTIGSGETLALSGSGSIAASSGVADDGTFDISGLTARRLDRDAVGRWRCHARRANADADGGAGDLLGRDRRHWRADG